MVANSNIQLENPFKDQTNRSTVTQSEIAKELRVGPFKCCVDGWAIPSGCEFFFQHGYLVRDVFLSFFAWTFVHNCSLRIAFS